MMYDTRSVGKVLALHEPVARRAGNVARLGVRRRSAHRQVEQAGTSTSTSPHRVARPIR